MGLRFWVTPPLGGVKTAQQFWWGQAAKCSSASFRLRTRLRFVNACLRLLGVVKPAGVDEAQDAVPCLAEAIGEGEHCRGDD